MCLPSAALASKLPLTLDVSLQPIKHTTRETIYKYIYIKKIIPSFTRLAVSRTGGTALLLAQTVFVTLKKNKKKTMLRLRTKPSINDISKSINSTVLYRKINTSLGMGKKILWYVEVWKKQITCSSV